MNTWRQPRILGLAIVGLGLVIAGAFKYWRAPELPQVDTHRLDPAIAALLEETLREVRTQPKSGAAWGKLGSVLMHYEFPTATSNAFARAQELSRTDPRWPYLQGLSLMTDNSSRAIQELERAVTLVGDRGDAPRLRLAQYLAEQGRNADAAGYFQALLKKEPGHAAAGVGLARLALAEGRLEQGTNWLAGCLEDVHTRKAAHALLAALEQQRGNAMAADEAARRSASLPPDESWPDPFWSEAQKFRVGRKIWLEEASGLLDHGQPAAAERLLRQITESYRDDDEAWYLLGWSLNQQGRAEEAEVALREHLRRSNGSAKGHAQLGVALLGQKKYTEAIAVLEAGAAQKPTWREFQSNLGYAWLQLGQAQEAEAHYRQALPLDPRFVPTYTALAELSLRRRDEREARKFLREALLVEPENERVKGMLNKLAK